MKYELDLYDKWCEGKEEGIKEGRQEGLSEGIQKGLSRGKEQMLAVVVKNAFAQGLSLETVTALTQLSPAEVEEIRNTPFRS